MATAEGRHPLILCPVLWFYWLEQKMGNNIIITRRRPMKDVEEDEEMKNGITK